MPNLFDSSRNPKIFNDLQNLKAKLLEEEDTRITNERRRRDEQHRATHIFDSYEQALDWLVEHPTESISWHTRDILWDERKQMYRSYEQDYSYDGVMCYDVCRYYTKQEILDQVNEHQKWLDQKYPEDKGKIWWLDKYGKLDYVHTYLN